jgi:tetratricopeptide (TPR) repeat protein
MINKWTSSISAPQHSEEVCAGSDHLDSWKEIASYFRREIRTVQLWEKNEGLPIHRHFHKQLGSVYALRSELERWKSEVSRKRSLPATKPTEVPNRQVGCITLYVPPLASSVVPTQSLRRLCDSIVAKTIVALEQLNVGYLRIIGPAPSTTPQQQDDPAEPSGDAADFILKWTIEDEDRAGDGQRVDACLLVANTGSLAWSHTYRCLPNDAGEIPGCVAEQIAQCLWLKVCSSPRVRPALGREKTAAAREAYLRGRYFWNQRNEEGLRKAIHCFESAIQEDPQFPQAYSGLADALTLLSFYEIVSPSEAMPSARRAAQKAIDLDPNLAEAHASLADVLLHFDRDWHTADREYRRSIECNPGYALGYHWYANLLTARGQHEAAHIAIMHALEIDPVSIITLVWAGVTSHLAHQFDDAIKYYQSALELDPHFIWAHMYMAQALEQKGNFKGALREFETTNQLAGGSNCVKAMKAHTHAVAGDMSSALGILNALKRTRSHKGMPSYDMAAAYAALGESDQAVEWLNRACHERNMKLFTLTQDPRFDPLRRRPEFIQVVERVGLPQSTPIRG